MFSRACEYGLKAMICLAASQAEENLLNLEEISNKIGSPVAFTSKILQKLARENLVVSLRGPGGGFRIEENKLPRISLLQIVSAIDGDTLLNGCGLGLKTCSERKPCPIHNQYSSIRADLKKMLENTRLKDFTGNTRNHKYVLTQ